ncbi:MAG: response regulator [bacterium]|nr:response regulator [bacterium]
MKVLIAEDELPIRQLLVLMLQQMFSGVEINEASTLEDAKKWCKKEELPDLAIVDGRMPDEGDGLTLMMHIRAKEQDEGEYSVKIVFISGDLHHMSKLQKQAFAAGANACLPKPFDMKQLKQLLSELGFNKILCC